MPGVIGCGLTPHLAAQVCGVSRKLNHSNSMPAITEKPIFSARARTRFRVWRGQIGDGVWSGLTNSPRKNGTLPSHGTLRCVARSRRASASGKPCCQPVSCALS